MCNYLEIRQQCKTTLRLYTAKMIMEFLKSLRRSMTEINADGKEIEKLDIKRTPVVSVQYDVPRTPPCPNLIGKLKPWRPTTLMQTSYTSTGLRNKADEKISPVLKGDNNQIQGLIVGRGFEDLQKMHDTCNNASVRPSDPHNTQIASLATVSPGPSAPWKLNMSFPDYVSKFRRKMVEIRSRFRETARLGLYADYWVPPSPSMPPSSSSSTPTAPYSTADILYNNEVSLSQKEDLRQSSFTDSEKNREPASRQKSKEIDTPDNRRPSSKSGSKKSLSIESDMQLTLEKDVTFDREDSLKSSTLPPPKGTNHFRPNGIRNNVLKGEPLFSTRSSMTVSSSGREADDLIAMGSLWSPNQTSISLLSHHQSQSQSALHPGTQPPHHQRSSYTNTMSAGLVNISNSLSSKSLSLNTNSMQPPISTAPASMTLQRKLPSNGIKPIMVQNNLSGLRSIKEKKEEDAKYSDPLTGATPQFLQRVQELQALEGETIRWERTKKIKKKKQDRDS